MTSKDYWQIFMETGAPEFYLLYHNARKTEIAHVPDYQGFGVAGNALQ